MQNSQISFTKFSNLVYKILKSHPRFPSGYTFRHPERAYASFHPERAYASCHPDRAKRVEGSAALSTLSS